MKVLFTILAISLFISSAFSTDIKVNGVYTAWAQSQKAFTFDEKTYDDNYVVQMLRFKLQAIANENIKLVTRFDMAQGWWGVDNADRSVNRTSTGGGSALFDFKDTNFLFHVDQAYVDFKMPSLPINARVGRMWYGLGNKIMVDNNYDGIQLDLNDVIGQKLSIGWAKVNEGGDNINDRNGALTDSTNFDNRDADLFTINLHNKTGNLTYDIYGFYYNDGNREMSYLPNNLNFFRTRFSPNISHITAFGVSATYKMDNLTLLGEADYLMGSDDIANTVHGNKQMNDINNGDLSGHNIYAKATYAVNDKLKVGLVGGLGSGDDDLTSGEGNINKLRTSGFFYITEIWEDSIMPDEEGITPQGLGAPNVRGYRELENTTIIQINGEYKICEKLTGFLSYSHIMSTEDIYEWVDGAPNMNGESATDLGSEIDFRFSYKFYDELSAHLRGGYFMPGDAAGYLINGSNTLDDPAYEIKGMLTFKF